MRFPETRKWLARKLVCAARKVCPRSPQAKEYYLQCIEDQMIVGGSMVRIGPEEWMKAPEVGKFTPNESTAAEIRERFEEAHGRWRKS